jgi:hypothetical protein
MEVLDMFENEVVKISDQILSTYLFYLVFFKKKLIDFSILINDNDLFPQYKQRLIDDNSETSLILLRVLLSLATCAAITARRGFPCAISTILSRYR